MRIELEQETLLNIFQAIEAFVDEPVFTFTAEGMGMRAMDPSQVVMVDFFLPKDAFSSFVSQKTLGGEEKVKVCVNLDSLLKLIKRGSSEDKVALEFTAEGKAKVEITGKYHKNFNLPTLEIMEDEETPLPKVTFNAKVGFVASELKNIIDDLMLVTDYAKVYIEKDTVDFKGQGDLMQAEINLKVGDQALMNVEVKEPVKSTYSLGYIHSMVKAKTDVFFLHASTDMPLKLECQVAQGARLDYYLAPRIEVE